MPDLPADVEYLYRGVPYESRERKSVNATGEVRPPRPDHIGESWRDSHLAGSTSDSGYTSWTTDFSIAVAAAEDKSDDYNLSGRIVVFCVRVEDIHADCLYPGREEDDEWLIEGTVESVSVPDGEVEE